MRLGSKPLTLLKTLEDEFGWIKFTTSFSAMLKELKFITA
jgi:hypothetical protein